MGTSISKSPSSKLLPSQTLTLIHSIKLFSYNPTIAHFSSFQPTNVIPNRKHKKLRMLLAIRKHLQNSYLVSPFNCNSFTVKHFKLLKKPLPDSAKLLVAKNTLIEKAVKGTKWEALGPSMNGMNALLFAKDEEIGVNAVKVCRSFQKENELQYNDFSGAMIEGKLYGHSDLEVLETVGSKTEVDAMLLGSLYTPASTLIILLQGFGGDSKEEASQ